MRAPSGLSCYREYLPRLPAKNTRRLAFNNQWLLTQVNPEGGVIRILWQQVNNRPATLETLDRNLIDHTRYDNTSVHSLRGSMHRQQVAVKYTGTFHAVAAHPQQIIGAWLENGRINRTVFLDILFGEDGRARRNTTDHGQTNHGIDQANTTRGSRHQFDSPLARQGAQVILRRVCGAETQPTGYFGPRRRATLGSDASTDQFQDF
jgi:hypothetical protein